MLMKANKYELFEYKRLLKPFCQFFTHHRNRRLVLWSENFEKNGFKNPSQYDFYYTCKICGYVFFNNRISKEDIEYIKSLNKDNNDKI